jgi:hypothetical protein
MKKRFVGRPGDIVRVRELGPIKPQSGHDLVAIFLGAAPLGVEPDVPSFLRSLGWARTHVFELTLHLPDEWTRQLYTAETPQLAAEAAVRAAMRAPSVLGLELRLMRLGPINPDGTPHNGRGPVFFRWSIDSGVPLEKVLAAPSANGA